MDLNDQALEISCRFPSSGLLFTLQVQNIVSKKIIPRLPSTFASGAKWMQLIVDQAWWALSKCLLAVTASFVTKLLYSLPLMEIEPAKVTSNSCGIQPCRNGSKWVLIYPSWWWWEPKMCPCFSQGGLQCPSIGCPSRVWDLTENSSSVQNHI